MQLGLNKQLQPHEIKSYKHKIKNQTSKNRKQCAIHKVQKPHVPVRAQKDFSSCPPPAHWELSQDLLELEYRLAG